MNCSHGVLNEQRNTVYLAVVALPKWFIGEKSQVVDSSRSLFHALMVPKVQDSRTISPHRLVGVSF